MDGANLTGVAISLVALAFIFLDKGNIITAIGLLSVALFYICVSLVAFLSKGKKKRKD